MKERTVVELGGEVWAEIHSAIDGRRDRGDHVLSTLDASAVEAVVDLVTVVLSRNAGKTIALGDDQSAALLLNTTVQERSHRRRLSARRLGITLQ